ncbi:MAG: lipopolysaccharide biosynthesis protein [Alphaproteobacteria bacterium]|nr:lipopolysaccharide biosynthesis protein [Alphaproteobacteria bacterium]
MKKKGFRKIDQSDIDHDFDQGDLGQKTATAFAFVIMAQIVANVVVILGTIFLARILGPENFGLMAMIATASSLLMVFENFGLYYVTVQRKDLSIEELNCLFWVNLAISCIIALLFFLAAPLIALYYKEPILEDMCHALSLAFLFRGAANQHTALLNRKMNHKKTSIATMIGAVCGTILAIILALLGAGVWSLVWRQVMDAFSRSTMIWIFSGWIPSWHRWSKDYIPALKVGGNLTFTRLMHYISQNYADILIGRVLGATSLGFYKLGFQVIFLPIQRVTEPISHVMIPMLSQMLDDTEQYRKAYLRAVSILFLIYSALGLFVVIHAPVIIDVIFGHEWIGAMTPMRYLAATMLVIGINSTSSWLFITQERTNEMLKWSVFLTLAIVFSISLGLPYGIDATALAFSLCVFAVSPFLYLYVGRKGPVKTQDFMWMIVSHLPLLLSFLTVQYVTMILYQGVDTWAQIGLSVVAGSTFLLLAYVFGPSRELILYLVYEIRHKLLNKQS